MAINQKYEGIRTLHSKEETEQRIAELAAEISTNYKGKTVHMFCVLNGAAHFFCNLTSKISGVNIIEEYIRTSSYGASTESSGKVEVAMSLDNDTYIKDKHIIIVEDIIDSGNTMSAITRIMSRMSPASIEVCTLLDKPERREINDFAINYCGFQVPNVFIVGYGLDYDKRYRHLPFIGYIPTLKA